MMSEIGGLESFSPEDAGKVSEGLSEQAKERFQAAQAAIKKIRAEEKRAKKRDDQVARAIIRFLDDEKNAHVILLISHLVSKDCPSIFILAMLSLRDEGARNAIMEFMVEHNIETQVHVDADLLRTDADGFDAALRQELLDWITRMQMVMSIDAKSILLHLLVDEGNIDGGVLQLGTFTLRDWLRGHGKDIAYEDLQPLAASLLQIVFEPFLHHIDLEELSAARTETPPEEPA